MSVNSPKKPARKSESSILKSVQVLASKIGARIFRNNVGLGYVGRVHRQPNGDILIRNPRPLHSGLCVGSSDLIGFMPVKITHSMVNSTVAIFTSVETKQVGKYPTLEQRDFLSTVRSAGGIGLVVRSDEDLIRGFDEYYRRIRGESEEEEGR